MWIKTAGINEIKISKPTRFIDHDTFTTTGADII